MLLMVCISWAFHRSHLPLFLRRLSGQEPSSLWSPTSGMSSRLSSALITQDLLNGILKLLFNTQRVAEAYSTHIHLHFSDPLVSKCLRSLEYRQILLLISKALTLNTKKRMLSHPHKSKTCSSALSDIQLILKMGAPNSWQVAVSSPHGTAE